jgi:hypothetical protein
MTVKLTTLSFSGGKQSTCILHMILNGDYKIDGPFIVLNADPGMENSTSYEIVSDMEKRCQAKNIPFIRVKRNLYQELIDLKTTPLKPTQNHKRFDNPPYWTKNPVTGKMGRLRQKCTNAYKITPMNQAIRDWMEKNLGIKRNNTRIGEKVVETLIGFSNDEWLRIKEAGRKFLSFKYPLIEKKMGEKEILAYYNKYGLRVPQRSVCNACFANDVATLKRMFQDRPHDWEQACKIDDVVRDLKCIGVNEEVYVSSTLIPLRKLAEMNFILPKEVKEKADDKCHSGYCFV